MSGPAGPGTVTDGDRRLVRTLRDGYWERTELVALPDGSLRVRKSSNPREPSAPWAVAALRREIAYLSSLPDTARAVFPPLLAVWDERSADPPRVGYEMPYYSGYVDAGQLARKGSLTQAQIDGFQEELGTVILDQVHARTPAPRPPFSTHLTSVVEQALDTLEAHPDLGPLIGAESIRLNGRPQAGPRAAFARAIADGGIVAALDGGPQVLLHGDLFLENILWRGSEAPGADQGGEACGTGQRLLLIDPVSVAGIAQGPPLFDLVKYESYATGELLALRSGWVEVGGFDGSGDYAYRVPWESPDLEPFVTRDWHSRLRRAFEAKYGPVDPRTHHLIDGYFSAAMAANTSGTQRRARLLKATEDFNAAADGTRPGRP